MIQLKAQLKALRDYTKGISHCPLYGAIVALAVVCACFWNPVYSFVVIVVVVVVSTSVTHRRMASGDIFSPAFVVSVLFITYAAIGVMFHGNAVYSEDTLIAGLLYLALFVCSYSIGFSSHMGEMLASHLPLAQGIFCRRGLRLFALLLPPPGLGLFGYLLYGPGLTAPLLVLGTLSSFRKTWGTGGLDYVW